MSLSQLYYTYSCRNNAVLDADSLSTQERVNLFSLACLLRYVHAFWTSKRSVPYLGTYPRHTSTTSRELLLGGAGACPLKKELLRSKILSNYWYGRTHVLPKIANITQHRQWVRQDAYFWDCMLRIPTLHAPKKLGGIWGGNPPKSIFSPLKAVPWPRRPPPRCPSWRRRRYHPTPRWPCGGR